MGSGFKDWTAGDVLTAADVDGYLMRQTVMTFADASGRDTALSGVLDEGMIAYAEDTDRMTFYTGSGWSDIVAASSAGVWTAYTPTLTNCTTSSIVARYCKINKTVIGFVRLNVTAVSGIMLFTTPTTMATGMINGRAVFLDNGGDVYLGHAEQWSTTQLFTRAMNVSGTYAIVTNQSTVVPFTWVSGDSLLAVFIYEEA